MSLQNFDTPGETAPEFINFCECLEPLEENGENDNAKKGQTPNENERKHHDSDQNNSSDKDTEKCCVSHGENGGHNTEDCNMLKKMVKKQKDNGTPSKPHTKVDYKPKQAEVDAMVIEAVKAMKKKKSKDKEKVQEELNAFEGMTLSDSEEDTVDSDDS